MRSTLQIILGLLGLSVITGALGVGLLFGVGWACLLISGYLAALAAVLIRGARAGG